MSWRVFSILVLLAATPLLAQVAPSASGGDTTTSDNSDQMLTPPPISGQDYPAEIGSEARSNYVRGGLAFDASYVDNLYAGNLTSTSEKIYSVLPNISFDQTRPRERVSVTYSPGFTFYEPTSNLNEVDHNLEAQVQYRLSPHLKLNATDALQRSSTAFGLQDGLSGGSVSGATQPTTPGILAPFAERFTNSASAQFSYQFSPVGMIGATGSQMILSFPNRAQSSGLYNSNERGGGAFFNRRINRTQYAGANYQYGWELTQPQSTDSTTQTHTIQGYYTIYPRQSFSISISGGMQDYSTAQTGRGASGGWGPSVTASLGWQGLRTNLAASYSRRATSGGGLLGVFLSNSANGSARWQLSRAWMLECSGSYANNKSISPVSFLSSPSGDSASGEGSLDYAIAKEVKLNFEYDRFHQNYQDIGALAINPNSDRVLVSLAWQFERPLGR